MLAAEIGVLGALLLTASVKALLVIVWVLFGPGGPKPAVGETANML